MHRRIQISILSAISIGLLGCGAKDASQTCTPANTWAQPVWNCAAAEAPPPEPEPDPVVAPEPEPEPPKQTFKAVLHENRIEILEKVQFETGSADILEESFALLDEVAEILEKNPKVTKLRVEGHTDSKGGKRFNKRLSQKRARAVRDYLIDKGIAKKRLTAKGFGQTKPIADNGTDEGRAQNRRVEFNIIAGTGVKAAN